MTKKNGILFTDSSISEESNHIPKIRKQVAKKHSPISASHIGNSLDSENKEKLERLVMTSNQLLFQCKTVFPFDLFPDFLSVDKTKVSIIAKHFFFSETVHSILIKNIKDVEIGSGIFFAQMRIIPDVYLGQTTTISYLKKREAYEARRIIQGLVLCLREGIDVTEFSIMDMKDKVKALGRAYYDIPKPAQ